MNGEVRKNMKKRMVVFLLSLFCTTVMFGCGTNTNNGEVASLDSDTQDTESVAEMEEEVDYGELAVFDYEAASEYTVIDVNGSNISTLDSYTYDGLGMVSANNSSRLLLDYKTENPEAYWEILNYIFGADGMHLSLIKIEMGADVDSSSGTEPAVKRAIDEVADVTRGAGYQLAADAKTINPDLNIDLLYWGEPSWVAYAEDKYAARYLWYKETIDAMYDTYGLEVNYVTVTQNEKALDYDWIKYFANTLDAESDGRYDYSAIQIVAGEAVGGFGIAQKMLADDELMDLVDVVTAHYTSWTTQSAENVQNDYDKKVWFSEGSSPMNVASETYAYDGTGSGLSGLNGTLDIATRITQAMAEGMTMYEFQPVVSSYYSGVTYYPKQLITANEPWSGAYTLDAGFYMTLHFSQFIKSGWKYVDGACFGDGVEGGDGHAIVDSLFNYMTCVDPETGDYSTVLVNNSSETIAYEFHVTSLEQADAPVYVWETRGPEEGSTDYYENFFQKLGAVLPDFQGPNGNVYTVVIQPYSMMTVSTLSKEVVDYTDRTEENKLLELPYTDNFAYETYDTDYLSMRGMTPRYTTDQEGAFEVEVVDGESVLLQKISYDNKPKGWAVGSDPITNLGDDRWANYQVTVDAHFTDSKAESDKVNYLGVGVRYILADYNQSGYWMKLYEDGTCELLKNNTVLNTTKVSGFDASIWHTLGVKVNQNQMECSLDGETVLSYIEDGGLIVSGRISLYSDFQNNYFDNIQVLPLESSSNYTITRMNDLNAGITYSEGSNLEDQNGWYFNTMCSFKNFGRTLSTGSTGDTVSFDFTGTGFAVIGNNEDAVIEVTVDDVVVENTYTCLVAGNREANYYTYDLEAGSHRVTIQVVSGSFTVDAIEIVD